MSTKSGGSWRLLWPALLLSGVGYVGLALWFPLLPNLSRAPAADILDLANSPAGGLAYAALIVFLFILLLVTFRGIWLRGIWAADSGRSPWAILAFILGTTLLLGVPLVLLYPVNATDIFRYAQQGRISGIYGGNPFLTPLTTYATDPFLPLAGEWAGETTPYGPAWEAVAALAAQVLPGSMAGTLVVFKAIGILELWATSVVLWLLLPTTPVNQRTAYVALWAWNPALLLTFIGHGHNDGLMILWLLLGTLAMQRRRPALGLSLVIVAALTKPIAALALPIYFVSEWRVAVGQRERWRLLGVVVAGTLLLTALAFLPWAGRGGWLASPLALVSRLAREANANAGFSPATLIYFAAEDWGRSLPVLTIGRALTALFSLFYLFLLWQTWRGRSAAVGVAGAFVGYVVQALNFRIWYAIWPFPFLIQAAAERGETEPATTYWLRAAYWFLLTTQLSVIIYGQLRVFELGESHALAHMIGVPFTFLLPLILARWAWVPTSETRSNQRFFTPTPGQPA